jgi:hypothetical protein
MYVDARQNFGLPTITNSTSATASPTILDAGSAKVLFGSDKADQYLWFRATVTADASPTIKVDLVASSESDLDPNDNAAGDKNLIIASTGVIATNPRTGAALASGDTVELAIPIQKQVDARRYYGLLVTLGGTNPDLAASQDAMVVTNAQSNMIGARAAVPA